MLSAIRESPGRVTRTADVYKDGFRKEVTVGVQPAKFVDVNDTLCMESEKIWGRFLFVCQLAHFLIYLAWKKKLSGLQNCVKYQITCPRSREKEK